MYTHVIRTSCMCIYIYTYILRERERERSLEDPGTSSKSWKIIHLPVEALKAQNPMLPAV